MLHLASISYCIGEMTNSLQAKKKKSAVASKIPFCVKKEMWKQLSEECHLCPDCQRGLVQLFRVRPEAAGRQTDAQTPGSPIMC